MDELKNKYLVLFGSDATIPPRHIMKTLVKMKQDGTFDNKMKRKRKAKVLFKWLDEYNDKYKDLIINIR